MKRGHVRELRRSLKDVTRLILTSALRGTGLSTAALDRLLWPSMESSGDTIYRYLCPASSSKARAPQAAAVQRLEDRVATILGRDSHELLVLDGDVWVNTGSMGLAARCTPAEFSLPRNHSRRQSGFGVILKGHPRWYELAYGVHYPPSEEVLMTVIEGATNPFLGPSERMRRYVWHAQFASDRRCSAGKLPEIV